MSPKPMLLADIVGDIPKDKAILETRIHATIEPDLWPSFSSSIEEHGLYAMKNFRVEPNEQLFKPARHPFRLFFKKQSLLKPYELDLFPNFSRTLYHFKTFQQVASTPPADTAYLIDYIGVLLATEPTRNGVSNTTGSKYLTFHLTDIERNRMPCWLWETYADEVTSKLAEKDREKPIVVLLQLCRIRKEETVSMQTSFYVSKVIIDEHLPEIEDYRIRFMASYQPAGQSSGSVSSYSRNAATFGPTITLDKLKSVKEPKGYWFYGEVERVLSRRNWCYPSCLDNSCAKKVDSVGDEFLCGKCHKATSKPLFKYCMKLSVGHDDEYATVMLWDEICHLLLGKTALELHNLQDQVEGVPVVPEEIMNLVGKGYFFKVGNYGPSIGGGRTYTINALCNDPEIMATHKPEFADVVEVHDSDDDLDLLFPMEPMVDSNQFIHVDGFQTIEQFDKPAMTPSSKRNVDEDDVEPEDTPTTKTSTSKKLKTVKKEKP